MIPRRIPIKGSRINGPGNITHPRANPLTLRVTPDAGAVPVTGPGLLRAEIRASATDDNTPLATVQMVNPEGSGPWDITFSGPQLNQQLDGRPSRRCWLVVYLLDGEGQRDTLHTANLTITEDGASLASAVPPDVDTLLDQSTADGLYAPLSLEARVAALEYVPLILTGLTVNGLVEIIREKGSPLTGDVNLAWTRNKVPSSLEFNQGIGTITPATLLAAVKSVNISADADITLTASDGTTTVTRSVAVRFRNKCYWGTSAATALNNAGVQGLANSAFATGRGRTITVPGNGQYIYVAYPKSFGYPTFKVGGLITNAWVEAPANFSFTNLSGFTEDYYVFRTTTVQNTTLTIEIS